MNESKTKPFFASQTVIAGLLIVVFAALRVAGVPMSETDTAEASEHVSSVLFGLLGLWAIWGRVRASRTLTLTGSVENPKSPLPVVVLAATLVLGGCAAACATGCAASPTTRWAQQREALTTTQNLLVIAHRAGRLSDGDLVKLDPPIQAVRMAIASAEKALPAGGNSFEHYMAVAETILNRLLVEYGRELYKTQNQGDGHGPHDNRGGAGGDEGTDSVHRGAGGPGPAEGGADAGAGGGDQGEGARQ